MGETVTFYEEKPDKIWAITPAPDGGPTVQELTVAIPFRRDGGAEINEENLAWVLSSCSVGLAHTRELAQARMQEAFEHPRRSSQRLYEQSFVEASYKLGPLAVLAYTAQNDTQPEEWIVEAFLGDAVVPEERVIPMNYPPVFGVDVSDYEKLNAEIEHWFPA